MRIIPTSTHHSQLIVAGGEVDYDAANVSEHRNLLLKNNLRGSPMPTSRHEHRVNDLPDAPRLAEAQYAGLIEIDRHANIFYWFFESKSSPSKDPIVIWLNGGNTK